MIYEYNPDYTNLDYTFTQREGCVEFVNRKPELATLEKIYQTEGFQFLPVYGRRRIGKTRLIQEFIKNKSAIYFLADSVSESEQLKSLGRLAGEYFDDTILLEGGFKNWPQFFSYLRAKSNKRLILVIDEFPYLVNSNKAIAAIFQKGIDETLKSSNLFLILMGSSIGMMEREVLYYKAPLYGRRTASMELKEMSFPALREFFPDKKFDELVQYYGVFGMVPAYLEKIQPRKEFFQNIFELILDKGTFLYNEVEYILKEELREPRNYFVILKAIAQGKRKLSEIISETGFEKSLVSKYIDTLRGLRFLEKEVPVTEKYPDKSKMGFYRIHDHFFSFWFKYIFPHKSRIEIGRADYVLALIKESFHQHLSFIYEAVCRDLCQDLMARGHLQYTAIGRWWTKQGEIDLVALDEETDTIYFGECKWSHKKAGDDIFRALAEKAQMVDWHKGKRKEKYLLFSNGGFTRRMMEIADKERVLLIDQATMVSEL